MHVTAPRQTLREGAARIGDVALHYLEWGDPARPTILLTHGITAQAHVWAPFAAELAGEYHLISLDQRGHGDSDQPEHGYEARHYAADMAGLMDALRVERAVLVGHSLGARNSLFLGGWRPDRVEAIVAVDFGPWISGELFDRLDQRVLGAPRAFASREEAMSYLAGRFSRHTQAALDIRADFGLRRLPDGRFGWKYSQAAVAQTLAGLRADFSAETLRRGAPTLVVRGASSAMYDAAAFERLRRARPDFELVELDATHYVHEEQPAVLARLIRDFVKRRLPPSVLSEPRV